MIFPVNTLVFILFLAGIILLQIFLSKGGYKQLGLILPGFTFLLSIIAVLNVVVLPDDSIAERIIQVILIFLVWNISTIILRGIYFACGNSFKRTKS